MSRQRPPSISPLSEAAERACPITPTQSKLTRTKRDRRLLVDRPGWTQHRCGALTRARYRREPALRIHALGTGSPVTTSPASVPRNKSNPSSLISSVLVELTVVEARPRRRPAGRTRPARASGRRAGASPSGPRGAPAPFDLSRGGGYKAFSEARGNPFRAGQRRQSMILRRRRVSSSIGWRRLSPPVGYFSIIQTSRSRKRTMIGRG